MTAEPDRTSQVAPQRTDRRRAPAGTDRSSIDLTVTSARLPADVRAVLIDEGLGERSPGTAAARLAVMVATLAASTGAAVVVDHPAIWAVHAVVAALVLTCSLAAEHEALHGAMFHRPVANHAVGLVVGALTWVPYGPYREYHLRHHRRTHMQGDTEPSPVIGSRGVLVLTLLFGTLGLVATTWRDLFSHLRQSPTTRLERRRRGLAVASLAAAATFAGVLGVSISFWGLRWVLVVYVVPLAVHLVLSTATFLPEHYECRYGPAPVWETTRTTVSTPLMRFVLWNANLHTAHHLVPSVPCSGLPRLHRAIEPRCTAIERGYWGYYRGLWRRLGRGQVPDAPPWQT